MTDYILQTENLCYTYPDGIAALCGVNMKIEIGSKVFFHGANGAGKTTLFQCLNGLLGIKRGTVRIHGKIVQKETERMKQIGIVFQNASDQIICGSVFDEIAFGPLNRGFSLELVKQRVQHSMEIMGIEHLRNKPPHFLSYGEKKRLAIASVLSMDQEIVILDEPTSGLDANQKAELIGVLDRLVDEGRTLLISTHDADFSFRCADRIMVLDHGRLICDDTPEKVFLHREIMEKSKLVKPILMEVYENLVEYGYIMHSRIPTDMKQFTQMLGNNHE